jgi:hypothetical protein
MEALGWRTWALMISVFSYSDWDIDGSPYACSWHSIWCIVTSSLLCELSHTLSPYAYLKCGIAIVLTWSHNMYYNWSILYLASYAAWFIHHLWSAPVRLCLLLARLDLFAACRVHWSDYICFLYGLICSPLCVTMPWSWPMFTLSWCSSLV